MLMRLPIPFAKLSGSGNDFILIDNRDGIVPPDEAVELARGLCRPRLSIGADGLILIEGDPEFDFAWRFFNADGTEPMMCGNGSRCAARFAFERGIAGSTMTFRTGAGPIAAKVAGRMATIRMTPPRDLVAGIRLPLDHDLLEVDSVNTGVPHAVMFVPELSGIDVARLGAAIRNHPRFAPAGTNVNFAQVTGPSSLSVRTFERGVEGETLACGTGVVASSLAAAARGLITPPVAVTVASGETLSVDFAASGQLPSEVDFAGDVRWVMDGAATPEALFP
jgi:diaminopimelate epimerase